MNVSVEFLRHQEAGIREKIAAFHTCSGPVWGCEFANLYCVQENKFQPWKFGDKKVSAVCSKCFKRGTSKSILDFTPPVGSIITEDDRSQSELRTRREREAAYKLLTDLIAKIRESEQDERSVFYLQHLQSDYWASIRDKVISRDVVCRGCLVNMATQAHHLTYDNLGAEFAFELIGVCRPCHERIHGKEGAS